MPIFTRATFPHRGVAAWTAMTAWSRRGVGFDINCGVRLVRTRSKRLPCGRACGLVEQIFRDVLAALGGGFVKIGARDLDASWWKARAGW